VSPALHFTRRAAAAGLLAAAVPARAALPPPQRVPWPARRPAPPLDLPQLDGARWTLARARGQVLVLNFWASWCEPCRSELPSLEGLAARHEAQGLQVLAINFREGEATLQRFVAGQGLTLTVLRDSDGSAAKAWQVRLFPSTVVVGRDGRPLFTVPGEADWGAEPARGWIAALL
jgi:thiol-disulfide isomerase/thioredoxin